MIWHSSMIQSKKVPSSPLAGTISTLQTSAGCPLSVGIHSQPCPSFQKFPTQHITYTYWLDAASDIICITGSVKPICTNKKRWNFRKATQVKLRRASQYEESRDPDIAVNLIVSACSQTRKMGGINVATKLHTLKQEKLITHQESGRCSTSCASLSTTSISQLCRQPSGQSW